MKSFSSFIGTIGLVASGAMIVSVDGHAESATATAPVVDTAPAVTTTTAPVDTAPAVTATAPADTGMTPAGASMNSGDPSTTPPAADYQPSASTSTSTFYANPESSNASAIASKQLLSIQAGVFQPQSVAITNRSYNFAYSPDSLKSAWVEAGFGAHLFDFYGSFYFEMSLGYTSFEGEAVSDLPSSAGQNLSVMLLGFDPRIMYQATWFPIKFLIPFVDGGYQYTLYYQSGSSDLQSVEGGVGNAVAGAGLAIWLNRGASMRTSRATMFSSFPIYLTAKVNQVFPRSGGLDLESRSFLGGVTFGL